MIRLATALATAALLAGCSQPLVTPLALDRPARPVLPAVTNAELGCLSDDAYRRVKLRSQLRRDYCEQLEIIIDSTGGSNER